MDAVKPTATASAPAVSGPITGTISTRPANVPTRSQYGSPIRQNASESTVATRKISSSSPRTNAPRRASIRSHVSRIRFRFGLGNKDATRSIVLSRSKIQYAADANVKKIPINTSNAVIPACASGFTSLDPLGRCFSRFWRAARIWCLSPEDDLVAWAISAFPDGLRARLTWWRAEGTTNESASAIRPRSTR